MHRPQPLLFEVRHLLSHFAFGDHYLNTRGLYLMITRERAWSELGPGSEIIISNPHAPPLSEKKGSPFDYYVPSLRGAIASELHRALAFAFRVWGLQVGLWGLKF